MLFRSLKSLVGEAGVTELLAEYVKPDFKDEGIFHRAVVLSVLSAWNK